MKLNFRNWGEQLQSCFKKGQAFVCRKLDWANKFLTPAFAGASALFGVLWEQDFAGYLKESFPQRTGLHELVEDYVPLLFIICFICMAILSSLRLFTQKTIGRLEADLKAEREKGELIAGNVETVVNGLLLRLSDRMNFSRGESSRLTIYVHNNAGHFIPFGRYTPDPSYKSKGRQLLPDTEGCIAAAWRNDWCYEPNLTYRNARQRYGITREAYESQRMKSRFFGVKRIDSINRAPLAVLVVESQTQNRFPEAHIQAILNTEEGYLSEIIASLRAHIPDPAEAFSRGF